MPETQPQIDFAEETRSKLTFILDSLALSLEQNSGLSIPMAEQLWGMHRILEDIRVKAEQIAAPK